MNKKMIRSYPLVERTKRLEAHRATGILHLTHEDETVEIYFYDGFIDAVSSSLQDERLGHYLLRHEIIEQAELERLLAGAQENQIPLGEEAVRAGIVEPSLLSQLLSAEAVALFQRAIEKRFTIGAFEPSARGFRFPLRMTCDQIVLQLARSRSELLTVDPGRRLFLKSDSLLRSLSWNPVEISVLSHLNQPVRLDELVSATGLQEEEVKKSLKVFDEIGIIQTSNGQPPKPGALIRRQRLPLELLIPEVRNAIYSEKLEVFHNENSFVSEQFKSLKVRIHEVKASAGVQIVNISSPHVQDGKSLVAANLGWCLSQDPGRRVLLLDCDLRHPSVQHNLGISLGPGLFDYLLTDGLGPQCFIRRVGNLYVMTAGRIAENPIELLSLSRMKDLMSFLKEEFDLVIVDSPPLLPISDTRVISSLVDATMMVVRRGKTPFDNIEKALRVIDQSKFLGVVFNDVKPAMFNTYYSYDYYYYGSKSGYPEASNVSLAQTHKSTKK